jgi:putative tRNA adenosine deaminase-associated protein
VWLSSLSWSSLPTMTIVTGASESPTSDHPAGVSDHSAGVSDHPAEADLRAEATRPWATYGATMWLVAYFTAVIAKVGRTWKARDVEVDDAETLDEFVDALRSVSVDDQPVLAVIEHEDEWFALARVDAEEEPRLFVSDLGAALHGPYGELLASAADVDVPEEDQEDGEEDQEDTVVAGEALAAWAGESDLLEDLGVSARTLRKLVEDNAEDPGVVLGEVGEIAGFGELLEALR